MPSDKHLSVTVTTGTIIKSILFLLLVGVLYYIRDIVLLVLTAVVIATAIEPFVRWFEQRRIPRVPAILLVYFLIMFIVVSGMYFVAPFFLSEVSNFLSNLPHYLEGINATGAGSSLVSAEGDLFPLGEYAARSRALLETITTGTWGSLIAFSGGLLSFMLIIVLSFYLAVQKTGVDDFLEIITPNRHRDYVMSLWQRSQVKIGRWMQGQILLVLIVGVLVYLGLTILGVRHALLLAVIAAFFEIIPVFGPILAAIPAVSVGFVDGGIALAFQIAALFVIVQQFENHLIYPLVVKKVVGVPALLVILALIIGAKLAGFFGIILSVPIAAVIRELVSDIKRGRKEPSEVAAE